MTTTTIALNSVNFYVRFMNHATFTRAHTQLNNNYAGYIESTDLDEIFIDATTAHELKHNVLAKLHDIINDNLIMPNTMQTTTPLF